jgi:Zn-finger nucleic acid-binding protein
MQCPRCSATQSLKPETYEGVEVDRCPKCQGVWLDEGELQSIVRAEEQKFAPSLVSQAITAAFTGVPASEHHTTEKCPKCSKTMNPMNYSYSSGIVLDRCPDAHGVWLDHQEIEKVQAHAEHWKKEAERKRPDWVAMMTRAEDQHQAEKGMMLKSSEAVGSRLFRFISKI